MTYGLGLYLQNGIVMTTDTRTNAGVDHIATISKLSLFETPGERVMMLASAGNLATTQAVVTLLHQRLKDYDSTTNLNRAETMFDAATMVGHVLREVMADNATYVQGYGDPSASFLFGGEVAGGRHRLFLIYPAGNFIEASADTPFLQIGETKYGKPILDRAMAHDVSLSEAVKLTLISFDATTRSNLSVAAPFDMIVYRAGSIGPVNQRRVGEDDAYYHQIKDAYNGAIRDLVRGLPLNHWEECL